MALLLPLRLEHQSLCLVGQLLHQLDYLEYQLKHLVAVYLGQQLQLLVVLYLGHRQLHLVHRLLPPLRLVLLRLSNLHLGLRLRLHLVLLLPRGGMVHQQCNK